MKKLKFQVSQDLNPGFQIISPTLCRCAINAAFFSLFVVMSFWDELAGFHNLHEPKIHFMGINIAK
jgi:hypothetical protein